MKSKKRVSTVKFIGIIVLAMLPFIWLLGDHRELGESYADNEAVQLLKKTAESYTSEKVYMLQDQQRQKQKEKERQLKKSKKLSDRFADALIIGDSIAEGILDYHVVNASSCIGVRGLRIDQLDDYFSEIKRLHPQILFLSFGMNDLEYWRGNEKRFGAVYEEKIVQLQERFPDTKVFVNLILPISSHAIAKNAVYGKWNEFNRELILVCKRKKIPYIDNCKILLSMKQPFEPDGIHPRPGYYKQWTLHMAEAAGL